MTKCRGENVKQMQGVDGQSGKYDDSHKGIPANHNDTLDVPATGILGIRRKSNKYGNNEFKYDAQLRTISDSANSGSVNA